MLEVAGTYIFRRMKKSLTLEFFCMVPYFCALVYSNTSRVEKNGPSEEKSPAWLDTTSGPHFFRVTCQSTAFQLSRVSIFILLLFWSQHYSSCLCQETLARLVLQCSFSSKPKVIYNHPSTAVVKNNFYCVTILYDGMRYKGKKCSLTSWIQCIMV